MSLDIPFTETTDPPIVIRNSKWKLLLMGLVSLAFVLCGLWMMSSSQSSKVYYEGLAALIFFGLCLLVFLFQMFTSSLLLTIDDKGIHSFYPFWRLLTMRWEEIYSIYPIKMRFINMLTITVSPPGSRPILLAISNPVKSLSPCARLMALQQPSPFHSRGRPFLLRKPLP